MIYYININKKKLCGRNNQVSTVPIILDYSTIEDISFQFINDQNQIQHIDGLSGLYFAGSLGIGLPSYDLLFLSQTYTIENDVLTFTIDTYTRNYVDKIKKKNTEINIEIGMFALDQKKLLMRDFALACPRVYVAGLSPQEIDSNAYYTKMEVDQLIADFVTTEDVNEIVDESITSAGFITEAEVDEKLGSYATIDYVDGGLSGKADKDEIPTKVSELDNDSDFVDAQYVSDATSAFITEDALDGLATEQYVDGAVSGKQDEINYDNPLDAHNVIMEFTDWEGDPEFRVDDGMNSLHVLIQENAAAITGKADADSIPLSTSQLTNDSGFITNAALQGYATEQYVDGAVSGKADKSEIPTKVSELDNDEGFITDEALSGVATEEYVDSAISGKQDEINYDNPLDAHNVIMEFTDWQGDPEFRVDDGMNSLHVLIQENAAAITGKADIADIPLSTSQLINDSGYATEEYVQAEVSGKQDVITVDNWLSAECVRTELDPWSGDPEYTVDAAINIVHQEALDAQAGLSGKADVADIPLSTSQLTNDSGFITEAAITGKQDTIDFDHPISASNVDFDFENWEGGDPNFRLDAALNMVYGFTKDNAAAITGKLDNPSGGTVGQVVKKTADGVEWADDAVNNPTFNTLEKKEAAIKGDFTVDFTGKQIQKYKQTDAVEGSVTIDFANLDEIPDDAAATVELQIPVKGAVTERIFKDGSVNFVEEYPEEFEAASGKVAYHDIVFRAEKDECGNAQVYTNYAYKFEEPEGGYLYFEAIDGNNTITYTIQYGTPTAPDMNYSLDKKTWTKMALGDSVTLANAGDKVYLRGNNYTINSPGIESGNPDVAQRVTFNSTGRVKIGGNLFTILKEDGKPKGLPYSCFNSFLRGMTTLVSAKDLIIPDTVYISNSSTYDTQTNLYYAMFRECTSLIDMPQLKQKVMPMQAFYAMFRGCTSLRQVVIPDATATNPYCYWQMFYGCNNLSDITVYFTTWTTATTDWLNGVSASGTFRCPAALDTSTTGTSNVPTGWKVDKGWFYVEAMVSKNVNIHFYKNGTPTAISLQYSKDGITWTNWSNVTSDIISNGIGDRIFIKGTNSTFSTSSVNYYTLTSGNRIKVGGNIMSLLDETMQQTTVPEYSFVYFFGNIQTVNSNLLDASELKLPATTLASNCYRLMFTKCSDLSSTVHELPAETIVNAAYFGMFKECSSLIEPPEIKAVSVSGSSDYAMGQMFYGCSSLTYAPELNIENVLSSSAVYNGIFNSMFYNCQSLSSINVNFNSWATNATNNWVSNVSPTGIFICPPELDTSLASASLVPSGWTIYRKY